MSSTSIPSSSCPLNLFPSSSATKRSQLRTRGKPSMMMKNNATIFLKQVWTVMGEVLKSKTSAAKTKAVTVRTRLIVLGLISNKKFLFSSISQKFHALLKHGKVGDGDDDQTTHANKISHKFQALLGHRKSEVGHLGKTSQKIHLLVGTDEKENQENYTEDSKAIVAHDSNFLIMSSVPEVRGDCPAAAHCGGDEEDDEDGYPDLTHCLFDSEDLGDPALSAVDVVKQRKDPQDEFVLEDEIDRVADLFIKRFRRQMKMQKQESFKAYHEMLDRSA